LHSLNKVCLQEKVRKVIGAMPPRKLRMKNPTNPRYTKGLGESSAPTGDIQREYFISRKLGAKSIKLPKDPKCELYRPMIPPGVIIEGDSLGKIPLLKYADHDFADLKKFLQLNPSIYLR